MTDLPWQAALIFLRLAFAAFLCFAIAWEKRTRIQIHDHWPHTPYSLRDKK